MTPNGTPTSSTTVALSDGGAGGTFTPTSLTFTTSTAQTFTYTPSSGGTTSPITLTASASGGFTASHTTQCVLNIPATGFTLTPSSLTTTPSVATGNYTVALNGTLSSNETIALSDASAGGTFSPTSLTFTSANAGTPQTFTYTPASGTGGTTETLTAWATGQFSGSHTASCVVSTGPLVVPVTSSALFFSPGNWDHLTSGTFGVSVDTMQATAPGAYLEFNVTGTVNVTVQVDNATETGFPGIDLPTLRYSINGGAFVDVQLAPSQTSLTISSSLTTGANNNIILFFKASSNSAGYADVWGSSGVSPTNVLRIKSVTVDSGATVSAPTLLPLRGIIAGDSITAAEHCNTDGSDDSTASFAWHLGRALNMEVGLLGYGGQAWTLNGNSNIQPFPSTWNYYSSGRPRTLSGLDFFAVCLGVNDARNGASTSAVQTAVQSWLSAARTGLGGATKIFVIVPFSGAYQTNLSAAVSAYKTASGDVNVFLIDPTTRLPSGVFGNTGSANASTYDGVHPLIYGHAIIAPVVADLIAAALGGATSLAGYSRSRVANA